jgi:hypothetical protein
MSARRRRWPFALALLLALLAAGLATLHARLPRLVLDRFHRISASMGEDYRGFAGGVEVDVLARHYRLRDVRIVRRDDADGAPLIRIDRLDVYLQPLAQRSRVRVGGVRIELASPGRLGENVPWRHFLEELGPGTRVASVEFDDTALRFHRAAQPGLVVSVDNLRGSIDGLATASAHLQAQGLLMAHAPLRLDARFDPIGPLQALRLRARAHEVELPKLNAFARGWAGLDFNRGEGEFALAIDYDAPRVQGAAAVSLAGVDVFDVRQDLPRRGLLGAVRELFAGAAMASLKDPRTERIEREFAVDVAQPPPQDNLEGVRAVLQAAFAGLGRYLPK